MYFARSVSQGGEEMDRHLNDKEVLCANCGGMEVIEKGDYCDLCEED